MKQTLGKEGGEWVEVLTETAVKGESLKSYLMAQGSMNKKKKINKKKKVTEVFSCTIALSGGYRLGLVGGRERNESR